MKIKIKNFNGELPDYLTMGKVYDFNKTGLKSGYIYYDDGSYDYIFIDKSNHLNGGSWEIVDA